MNEQKPSGLEAEALRNLLPEAVQQTDLKRGERLRSWQKVLDQKGVDWKLNRGLRQTVEGLEGLLPNTAVLELTYKCNHQCIFCSCPWFAPESQFKQLAELNTEDWKRIINQITAAGVETVAFTGGEPLMKAGWQEIIRHAAKSRVRKGTRRPKLYLLSNGKRMSSEVLDFCAEHNVALSLSLPGMRTFREHTGQDGANNVLKWLKEAEKRGVATTAGITVTQKNIGELYETMAEALLAGARRILLNRFLPGGRGLAHADELALSTSQIEEMLETAETVLKKARRYGHVGTELPACIGMNAKAFKHLQVGHRCAAAVEFFVIDPSGFVRVCNHSPRRLLHVSEMERLGGNSYWRRFVNREYLPVKCRGCGLASSCDAGCRVTAHVTCGSVTARERGLRYGFIEQ